MRGLNATELGRLADEELMALVQDGEPDAFELLYDRHGGAAYSLAYRMMGSRQMAEDVVQEALLSIWRSRARFQRERGSVRGWLLNAVHNRAIDALRSGVVHARRRAGDETAAEREPAPERTEVEAVRRDESERLRGLLAELPAEQSQVIELAYLGGFSHTEIAQMLAVPIGTIKGRMRLGLDKMRRALQATA